MIKKQQKQLVVQQAVMNIMERYRTSWQTITELNSKYDRYIRNLKKIEDDVLVLQTTLTPYKLKRKRARLVLTDTVFPITSVLTVYALDAGERKMGKSLKIKSSELEKMKADQLAGYSIRVLKICEKLLNPQPGLGKKGPKLLIGDYGLVEQHIEGLKDSIDSFLKADVDFREIRNRRRKSKAKIKKRIRENKQLLKSMDRMIHLFRDSQKEFYNAYIKSRIPGEPEPAVPNKQTTSAKKDIDSEKQAVKPEKQAVKPEKQAVKPKKEAIKTNQEAIGTKITPTKRPVGRPRKSPPAGRSTVTRKPPASKGRGPAQKK